MLARARSRAGQNHAARDFLNGHSNILSVEVHDEDETLRVTLNDGAHDGSFIADILVNAAGINVPRRSFETLSTDDWHRVFATNLHGAYYCVQAFLPRMRERQNGTIININSDVGKAARDLAGAAYVASKFGLRGLTQQINAEERGHGVRACSICPRDINTPLLDKRPQPPPPDVRARMLQPEDLAACAWLVATLPPRVVLDEISLSTR